jgi:hypothetical protein
MLSALLTQILLYTIYKKKKQEVAAIKKFFMVAKQQAGLDASAHFIPEMRSHNTE